MNQAIRKVIDVLAEPHHQVSHQCAPPAHALLPFRRSQLHSLHHEYEGLRLKMHVSVRPPMTSSNTCNTQEYAGQQGASPPRAARHVSRERHTLA
jgi:hypothetical protein